MDECIQYGLTKLNYSNIRHNQKEVVLQYTQGSDVLFCSPTGSGKSLTFEIAPYVLSFLRRTELLQELCVSVIVVSPLVSLMKSQEKALHAKGLRAVYLCDSLDGNERDVYNGNCDVILGSPESFLGVHRKLISRLAELKKLGAIFIDEAHCIRKLYGPLHPPCRICRGRLSTTTGETISEKAKADLRPGVPYSTIDIYIQHHQPTIQNMLKRKFIHASQLPLILPGSSDPSVDIKKWDISLVTTMLHSLFNPLSLQEQQFNENIRNVRNELLHKSGTAELKDNDFNVKWNILDMAVKGLAQCVSKICYNEMTSYIADLKTKPLPQPGPALDILKQWYTADKELHQKLQRDTKITMDASIGVKNILNDVVVRSKNSSGAPLKKIKTVDPVLEYMKEQFKQTTKRFPKEEYISPNEIDDAKLKFRLYHRVVITGKDSLEAALSVINDEGIIHDRCVQVTESDEARHLYCDDVDLILCINPFGKNLYDKKKSIAMTKQFDRLLENTNLHDIGGRIDVIIVSETGPFLEYRRLHDHDLLDQVVVLNKPTTETEPIQVSDCMKKTISQPEPILQNMIGQSGLYFEQFRGLHIDTKLSTTAKTLFKKHKAITITGPTKIKKAILAVRLMKEHQPDKCLVLTNPDDWKYVKLGDVSVLLISNFTGKCECDQVLYTRWLSIFDLIHAAVKGGKLNVMLTSHSSYLEQCQEQKGTHDLLKQRVLLAEEDIVKANIKKENDALEACLSGHDNETVSNGPYSYINESCLTYLGKYTLQIDDDGKEGKIQSLCTVSDGTFLMVFGLDTRLYLYHLDASYKYINKRTIKGFQYSSPLLCLNKREAVVCTQFPNKIRIVSLDDKMRVRKTIDIGTSSIRLMMAYMDGDFFIPSSDSDNNIDVYSVTGTKVRTIEYDRECGKDVMGELMVINDVRDIVVSEDRIVLRARDNKYNTYILCLKMDGERIWLLNVRETSGYVTKMRLSMDEKCNIYYILNYSEIHRVSACGRYDEVLLKYPGSVVNKVCIDVTRHMLYLYGRWDKMLQVYKLC